MLSELHIENFTIIDRLDLSFTSGFNVLTGETGAGKSIILGAVELLLGGRVSSELVRRSASRAVVEASFELDGLDAVMKRISSMDIDHDGELVIRRVLSAEGKNKVYINGQLATAAMLAKITGDLVDICGQHEHQVLLDRETHIRMLDAYGGLGGKCDQYAGLYGRARSVEAELRDLERKARDRDARVELLNFQSEEIGRVSPEAGEDDELEKERTILREAIRLGEVTMGAEDSLYSGDGSILDKLGSLRQDLEPLVAIDSRLEGVLEGIGAAAAQLEETAYVLRDYSGTVHPDPARLEALEERLMALQTLKRKYGATITEVLAEKERIDGERAALDGEGDRIGSLRVEHEAMQPALSKSAAALSKARKKAAAAFDRAMEAELATLAMEKATFETEMAALRDGESLGPRGRDRVEFKIATNPGEGVRPLRKIVSGGELSRIMLALRRVLQEVAVIPTLVFDEVDEGIGGRVAEVVGRKLAGLASRHQVICVTHLPQMAAFADTHFSVLKNIEGERIMIGVDRLDSSGRVEEVARMLGGEKITPTTRDHAREMIRDASRSEGENRGQATIK